MTMSCNICALGNTKIITYIEKMLATNKGQLTESNIRALVEEFPEKAQAIKKLTITDFELHYNFHQTIKREKAPTPPADDSSASILPRTLADDIGKDEAEVLYELLNTQSATFNALSNKVNDAIVSDTSGMGMNAMLLHPSTLELYKEIASSIRLTVREIRELNASLNGDKDGAFEGLKSLAEALSGTKSKQENDMTSKEFDK